LVARQAIRQQFSIVHASPKTVRIGNGCAGSSILETKYELEAGPDLVHRADLDVHETRLEADLAHDVIVEVGFDFGRALGPGHPEHPVASEEEGEQREHLLQIRPLLGEEVSKIDRGIL